MEEPVPQDWSDGVAPRAVDKHAGCEVLWVANPVRDALQDMRQIEY